MKNILFLIVIITLACSCTRIERIKDGSIAYERKQFYVAIPMLTKEFNQTKIKSEKGKKAYQLAESYKRTNQYDKAADWYAKATKERYSTDSPLKQAQMLQQAEKYDDAIIAYRTAGRDAGDANLYTEQIVACRMSKQWLNDTFPRLYDVENISVNNKFTDFSPVVYSKDKLLFSSDRIQSEGKDKYKWTGQKFFDFYEWNRSNDSIKRFVIEGFDSEYHQGNLVFNAEQNMLLFSQCGSDNKDKTDFCKIMFSVKKGNSWTAPKEIRLGATNINYMHPYLDPKGRFMIFASNDKQGYGGYDLYFSLWVPSEEKWMEPKNLGSSVNTKGNEVFPYVDKDTLYFSSDGLPGMGGLDIFKAVKINEKFRDPQNLKFPINSGGDDFGLILDPFAPTNDSIIQMGFFSSNRKSGKGSDDIFSFSRKLEKPKQEPVDSTPSMVFELKFEGKVKEKILSQPANPNSDVTGTKNLLGATVRISTADTAWSVGSEEDGSFIVKVDTGKTYFLQTTKDGFFSSNDTFNTLSIVFSDSNRTKTIRKEILLTPMFKGKEIVLKDVKFDYNKWNIRQDAAVELDKLVILLKQNPEINIQMTSHTDCRGSDRDNLLLSQRRAESTMNYLIENGINSVRLQARGFGETTPAVQCVCSACTEEQHQENRRTSFVILE